ncbi:GFA family protein [Burkholderia multivorans]|nr:GFA family protein [Burkholderia multivorans]
MLYHGSCHCGDVKFDVEGDLQGVMACNCSICRRKGALMWFVPRDRMTLVTPDEHLATYTFNKHVIRHRFCKRCGIHPFGEGIHPNGTAMAAINVRCLDDVDLDALPVTHFDGRSH